MDFFDLHCDTPYECYFKNQPFYKNSLAVSGEKGKIFDNWKQVFAVWIRDDVSEPYRLYRAVLDGFKEKLGEKPECLTPYFAVEGGAVTEGNTDLLYKLKEDGIRFLTLTWNGENRIAGGVNSEKGLTHFGRRVIEKLNELDIRCDLSHLNEKSFYKAAELADMPLVTHACCRAVCGHKRNLTDEQLKLISDKNGIVGLCLYPAFLGGNVYEKFYENVLHLLDMGMENSIAVGSDFDGADMSDELCGVNQIPQLRRFLCEKGLGEELTEKIFFKNAQKYTETFDKRRKVV